VRRGHHKPSLVRSYRKYRGETSPLCSLATEKSAKGIPAVRLRILICGAITHNNLSEERFAYVFRIEMKVGAGSR
jgi:hypothetical protein